MGTGEGRRRAQAVEKPRGAKPPAGPNGVSPAANVEQIRDILFGTQMQEYDLRFAGLEERLLKASADLRDELKKRVAALEQLLKKETETLAGRVKAEQQERTAVVKELSASLQNEIQQRTTDLAAALKRESTELRAAKVDRTVLAAMLTELAARVAGDGRR